MNLERTIELLSIERECISRDCNRNCGNCDLAQDRSELLKAYQKAIQELKHRIPANITHEATNPICSTCPTCKNVVGEVFELFGKKYLARVPYCEFCGQYLNWSELKEGEKQ